MDCFVASLLAMTPAALHRHRADDSRGARDLFQRLEEAGLCRLCSDDDVWRRKAAQGLGGVFRDAKVQDRAELLAQAGFLRQGHGELGAAPRIVERDLAAGESLNLLLAPGLASQ